MNTTTTDTMTAAEKLAAMCLVVRKHEAVVTHECRTLDASFALMKKWNESRLNDAISREAKSRMCKELA